MDTSPNARADEFGQIKTVLMHFMDRYQVFNKGIRMGLVTFHKESYQIDFDFKMKKQNKGMSRIKNLQIDLDSAMHTDQALQMAEKLFTREHGDRPSRRNILFVFTDARELDTSRRDYEPIETIVERLEVRASAVNLGTGAVLLS